MNISTEQLAQAPGGRPVTWPGTMVSLRLTGLRADAQYRFGDLCARSGDPIT